MMALIGTGQNCNNRRATLLRTWGLLVKTEGLKKFGFVPSSTWQLIMRTMSTCDCCCFADMWCEWAGLASAESMAALLGVLELATAKPHGSLAHSQPQPTVRLCPSMQAQETLTTDAMPTAPPARSTTLISSVESPGFGRTSWLLFFLFSRFLSACCALMIWAWSAFPCSFGFPCFFSVQGFPLFYLCAVSFLFQGFQGVWQREEKSLFFWRLLWFSPKARKGRSGWQVRANVS